MSLNHHMLAKRATDAILAKFKNGAWTYGDQYGRGFYRTSCNADFPSPDAAFCDPEAKATASFEFKPPTETKRGILTGLGQALAYLRFSNLSYLIIPEYLEDFKIADYMQKVFSSLIEEKMPLGLIAYKNDDPYEISMLHRVAQIRKETPERREDHDGSFWAKHLDMPIPLFHLILHYLYQKKVNNESEDAFAKCWKERIAPVENLKNLVPSPIYDVKNDVIKTLTGKKDIAYFETKINNIKKLSKRNRQKAIQGLLADADVKTSADNMYSSVRKNCLNFMRHVGMLDSLSNLTDAGFQMYHLGLMHGPNSQMFRDYFTRMVLIDGHHIDLIYDLDRLSYGKQGQKSFREIKKMMLEDYESRGMIKRNPNRRTSATSASQANKFLGHEMTLWRSLGLLRSGAGEPAIVFNWQRITEVCNLNQI